MYGVWFCDLQKVIAAMAEKVPTMETFTSIEGNADGDFVVRNCTITYIVRHTDFSVWKRIGSWKEGRWERVE